MANYYTEISEVFIGDPVDFRSDIFKFWIKGCPIEEAVNTIKKETSPYVTPIEDEDELIRKDVQDSVLLQDCVISSTVSSIILRSRLLRILVE